MIDCWRNSAKRMWGSPLKGSLVVRGKAVLEAPDMIELLRKNKKKAFSRAHQLGKVC